MPRLTLVLAALLAAAVPVAAQNDPLRTAADSMLAMQREAAAARGWSDFSDSTRRRREQRLDRIAAQLRAIDRGTLDDRERLLFDNLSESVQGAVGTRVCRRHLWAAPTQFGGWHVAASNLARGLRVGSDTARAEALELFRKAPRAIADERDMLRRGLDSGYTISADVIRAVIRQLDDLTPTEIAASPLYAPAQRDSSDLFRRTWQALIAEEIYPAVREYRAFLERDYLPRARAEGSLASMPNGARCYAAILRAQTSLESNVDSVARSARGEIDRILGALAPIVRQLTGDSNTSRGVIALRTAPEFTFPHRDSVLAAYRAMTQIAARRVGRAVAGYEPESLAVLAYPAFQERANLPPQYRRAPDDGSRSAEFLVNLARTERMAVANAVAHEGYPGHHLQRIAAVRAAELHPVMAYIGVSGFTEGWGIYAEEIGEDMGLYTSLLDSAGVLVHLLDVAAGNYLDISYHTRGWTREMLVDSMVILGGRHRSQAEAYADRHAAIPGQLGLYFVGYRAIRDARVRAERRLGGAFSAPEFHREVLRDGSITLASLQAKLDRWVEERRTGDGPASATNSGRGALQAGTLAITNVTVLPLTSDTALPNRTVLVRDGLIAGIAPSSSVPDDARVIDGSGKFLIPGLADMHTHLFSDAAAIHDSAGAAELGVMLANGVTAVRLMIGTPEHLRLREAVRDGRVAGPQLWVASPHINDRDRDNAYLVETPAAARDAVRSAAAAGYDFVKVTFVDRPLFDEIVDEAARRGIRVVGHADPRVGLARALESGAQLEHLDSYFEALLRDDAPMRGSVTQYGIYVDSAWRSLDYMDDAKIARLAGATARAGATIGPTQNVFVTAFAIGESDSALQSRREWNLWPSALRSGYLRARARYWGDASQAHRTEARRRRYVEVRQRLIRAMLDSGVAIIAGSDTPEWFHTYGWGLHRELEAYVVAGLTPYEALRTATVNPAAYLGETARWGTIEVGKRADLLLLDGNPLEDIRNTSRIGSVIVGGRALGRGELDALVTRAEAVLLDAAESTRD